MLSLQIFSMVPWVKSPIDVAVYECVLCGTLLQSSFGWSITCFMSHPMLLSDSSSCLILSFTSFDTAEGFYPLLGLSFRPSSPSSLYLLSHLYAQVLDLCSSWDIDSTFCLSDDTLITINILSFTWASCSFLYTLVNAWEFN